MNNLLSRRDALKLIGCTGAGMMYDPLSAFAADKVMLTRAIPSSGEKIPVVGLGTWRQFDVGNSSADRQPLRNVLKRMSEKGGKVIDSSPMYARSEEVIGDLTQETGLADKFFYATKVWTRGKQEGIEQMNASFKKMRRSKMDLMQVHNLVDWKTHLETLRSWKDEGKVRYIGITHYTDSAHEDLEKIIRTERLDFVQFNYSIRNRNAEQRLLDAAKDRGTAVIINQPFESGSLFDHVQGKSLPAWAADLEIRNWAQFFLKYIISHPAVTCVIPGTSNPDHLVENMEAAYGIMPDNRARKRMVEYIA
jgi:diketogulonate reductase-like aldo/keto reductase